MYGGADESRPLGKGGSPYETHHIVVGYHGPDPVGGKRGGTGGRPLRWTRQRYPEGNQRPRCFSGQRRRRRPVGSEGSRRPGRGEWQGRGARRKRVWSSEG